MAGYPVDSIALISGRGRRVVKGVDQWHWGYDLAGDVSTKVYAPEAGRVTQVFADAAPFVGYGPGGVEILGASGVYHLLAHLAPTSIDVNVGDDVEEHGFVGEMSTLKHVHWEVRLKEIDSPSTREANTLDPQWWVVNASNGWTVAKGGGKMLTGSGWLLWLAIGLLVWSSYGR